MKNSQLHILFFTGLLLIFCHTVLEAQWGVQGNGKIETERRDASNFDEIEVEDGLDVYITQSDNFSVEVEADENLLKHVKTEVKEGILKLHVDKSIWKSKSLKVHVSLPSIRRLEASGGSDVYSKNTLRADKFKLHTRGGSDVKLSLDVKQFIGKTSGGSDAELEGEVEMAELYCNGGSDLEAKHLSIKKAMIRTSGGSDAYITVVDELNIEAAGASDVYVYGNPTLKHKRVSGASDLHWKSL